MNEQNMNGYQLEAVKESHNTREIEITEDDSFNYDGYQVVRGEFFAHTYEPSFSFNKNKVSVNTACIKKLPDTDFVQILVNPDKKKLAVRPCSEDEKDSFRWCSVTKKRSPRQITCRVFFAKVISLMEWNPNYRYKLLGKLIRSNGELLFVFDLTTPEIFTRIVMDDSSEKTARTASYPEEWKNQFGLPISEHQSMVQINLFDGYTVFGIQNKKSNQAAPEAPSESLPQESEEPAHDQNSLVIASPVY